MSLRTALLAADATRLSAVTLVGRQGGEAFPVWNALNGPLADALTHVGQIAAWRRLAQRPVPRADVFRGRPPKG